MRGYFAALLGALICALPTHQGKAAEIYHDLGDDGKAVIIIEGEIVAGDDVKFRDLSVRFPKAFVALNSIGGAIAPAFEIGRQIRLRGYVTAVLDGDSCTSACALIWLAGSPRLIQGKGRLGFHASYRDEGGRLVETGVGNAMVGHYLSQLNLPERAVIFATRASPYEINWLDESNRNSAGIDFRSFPASAPATAQPSRDLPRPPPPVYIPPAPIPPPIAARPSPRLAAPPKPHRPSNLTDTLRATLRRPGFSESVAAKFDVSATQKRIIGDHVREIYGNDKFIQRIAVEMEAAGSAITGPQAERVGFEIASSVTEKLLYSGLMRVPNADVKQFIDHLAVLSLDATPTECGQIFWPGEEQNATLEFKVVGRQGDAALRGYLAVLRRAIFADLELTPAVVKLTTVQDEAAEAAFVRAIGEITSDMTDAQRNAVADTFDNMDASPLANRCDAMALLLSAAARMPGVTGEWYRRKFIKSIEE